MNKLIVSTLVAAGFAASVPLTLAQTANPGGDAPRGHFQQRQHHERQAFSLPSERVEARLAYMKTALKITDAQQPQWDAFANVLRQHASAMDKRIQERRARTADQAQPKRVTAIDRLELTQQRLAGASARLNELLAVEKPLYAALTPEQQRVADKVLAPRRHGMGHHNRGMFRGV